jgi:hypothetical protein
MSSPKGMTVFSRSIIPQFGYRVSGEGMFFRLLLLGGRSWSE